MKINLEVIENILPCMISNNINEKKKLENKLNNIKQLFEKKINLKKLKYENQSKILVQNQVLGEAKRRSKENIEYFEEKFEELCNGLEKKIIFIKKYQKKFDEVQIYIQRECQYYPRYKKLFDDYEIMPFILKNENLLISKKKLIHEIKLIVKQFNIITKENYYIETRTTHGNNEEKVIDKYKSLIDIYLQKNKIMQEKVNKLKKIYNNAHSVYRLKNITNQYINNKEQVYDDVKALISGSILNNSKINESLNTINSSKISKNFGWDISCIDKNEII
jgi:hypothetical protein